MLLNGQPRTRPQRINFTDRIAVGEYVLRVALFLATNLAVLVLAYPLFAALSRADSTAEVVLWTLLLAAGPALYSGAVVISYVELVPVRVRATGAAGTEMADTYLSSVICSYVRSLLEFALDGRYDRLDGWVFSASCDHLRRLYDNLAHLAPPKFNYIIDLPHKTSDAALDWFVEFAAA